MISKELLSEVLGENVSDKHGVIGKDNHNNNFYYLLDGYKYIHADAKKINIYELAHKCKEWAMNEGYEIVERKSEVEIFKGGKRVARFIADKNDNYNPILVIDYASQWILEQLDNQ